MPVDREGLQGFTHALRRRSDLDHLEERSEGHLRSTPAEAIAEKRLSGVTRSAVRTSIFSRERTHLNWSPRIMQRPDDRHEPKPAAGRKRRSPDEWDASVWTALPLPDDIPSTSHHEKLQESGVEMPPAESLGDAALTQRLWEIIGELAERNVFLQSTDHLSDRELYVLLTTDILPRPTHDLASILPPEAAARLSYVIDFVSIGSEEEIQLLLRYYCSDEVRRRWQEGFPEMQMPPKEDPPHDRDRLLPRPEEGPAPDRSDDRCP